MTYSIVTTQPGIYDSFLKTGLISRGIDKNVIEINVHDLHDYSFDAHRTIDDTPAGGGAGMVIKVDVVANAIDNLKSKIIAARGNSSGIINLKSKIILLTPQGKKFSQNDAKRLAKMDNLILIAGRFEGYDERIRDLVDEEISIGDFVLTSGDLPAMILIDATSRMIPGFIEKSESIAEESFSLKSEISNLKSEILLEYPQYTRPVDFQGKKIPAILLSGNHTEVNRWRMDEAQKRTLARRPDMIGPIRK